ncbi:MAG TPA: HemK/PrmC family methyltransferase [Candidatus Saccharimonadales bacterium]|nr:HemK/PrmC family methyltransferase [Candidatus Saccharimonadales bacterium]
MKADHWLAEASKTLTAAGISTARLDALVLLEDETSKDRSWLLAHPELELGEHQIKELARYIKRRVGHEPLAYIRNKTEFYGREFYINHQVLEPRPESETMIDALKGLPIASKSILLDIGTGSGALAITAILETHCPRVFATDIDPSCLNVAKKNAKTLGAEVVFLQGSLLEPFQHNKELHIHKPYIVLANLPYVPDDFQINEAAMTEPRIAIFGGKDGLDLYRKLFRQLHNCGIPPAYVLTEAMPPQHEELAKIAKSNGFNQYKNDDFIEIFMPTKA